MLAAASWTAAGAIAATIIVGLLVVFAWLTRERRYARLRVGFFVERERFEDDGTPATEREQHETPPSDV